MGKRKKNFAGRLTRTIIIIVLVVMTVISMLSFLVTASGIYSSYTEHFADAIDGMSRSIMANLEKVEISAANIADEVTWHISSPEDVIKTLAYEIKVNHTLTGCGVAFVPDYFPEKGRWFEPYATCVDDEPLVRVISDASHDYHEAEWFLSGKSAPKGIWSRPYLDTEGAGTLVCTFSQPIYNSKGDLAAVIGTDLSLIWLTDLMHNIVDRESRLSLMHSSDEDDIGIYGFILGPDGEYITHPDQERFLKGRTFFDYTDESEPDKYRMLGEAMCARQNGEKIVRMDGRKYDVFFAPVLDTGWSMAIAVPLDRLLSPAFTFGSAILFLMLLGLAIVSEISHRAIKRFTKPLVQLAGSAKEVARGKFDTPLPTIKTDDEIRLLRDSFDNMQQSLSKYIADLTETTAQKASMENELDVARKIQMSMLPMTWPAFPERKDIDIYGGVTPAKAVGGDLYDFFIRDGKLFFCIGDVSGKGVPASLVMAVTSSMFRTLFTSEDDPDKLVSVMNSSLSARNESLMFVTLFAGVLDLETGVVKYCNAGHNPPVVVMDGVPHMLETDANVPIGIMPDWQFSLQTKVLSPGSALFLYTDGLTEASRVDGTLFGDDRVLTHLADLKTDASSKDVSDHMKESVKEFVGNAEQSDDITMLIIRVLSN